MSRPTANAPRTLQFTGATVGVSEFYTLESAVDSAREAAAAGVQWLRVVIVWNSEDSPPSYNLQAVCNAALAAQVIGLRGIVIGLEPKNDLWPHTPAGFDRFNAAIAAYDTTVFGDCFPGPRVVSIAWMIGNEPNIRLFCNGDDLTEMLAQHQECALREAELLHSSYAFIKSEERKYNVTLPVIGGGISSHDAPFDFLTRYKRARTSLGYTTCDMDFYGFHPYALIGGNAASGLALEPRVAAALTDMKCPVPIIYTEMGYETPAPPGHGYAGQEAPRAFLVPMEQYPAVVQAAVSTAQNQGVAGYFNMLLKDEQLLSPGWQSGWFYWDGEPKPFLSQIRQILLGAGSR